MTTKDMRIIIRGQDRRDIGHYGHTTTKDLTAFVQRRYEQGWSWLTVTDAANPSYIIGCIETWEGSPRTWWVES